MDKDAVKMEEMDKSGREVILVEQKSGLEGKVRVREMGSVVTGVKYDEEWGKRSYWGGKGNRGRWG